MTYRIGMLVLALLLSGLLSAQDDFSTKFGRISDEERSLMTVPGDTTAEAYVLYDKLELGFDFHEDKGPVLRESFHRRLKLLKPSSFDRANITLSYDRTYQDISGIDAAIHLPEGGSVKLKGKDIIQTKGDDGIYIIKFTFPQVTPGAIIEYAFTKRTENILIPTTYQYQENIPVRWAEYKALIPIYYDYVSLGSQGALHINDVKESSRRFGPNFVTANDSENVRHADIHWVMKDLPAYELQPYTNNMFDYIPTVKLQLRSVNYPGRQKVPIFSNWKETVDELQSRRDFGRFYRNKNNYNQLWKEAESSVMAGTTDKEKIDAAYYFISRRLKWNQDFSFIASESPDNIMKAGVGNSADLNISLLALLNEAGIEAHPLLVSLRNGGAPIEVYPIMSQFDHLMVYTEVDGQPYLLDANGPERPAGLPRVSALNHRGWVADADNPRWVSVEVPRARRIVVANVNIDEEGMAEVDLDSRMESYYGFTGRLQLQEMESDAEAPLVNEILKSYPEAKVISQGIPEGADESVENLRFAAKVKVPAGMANAEYLYIQPILISLLDKELDDVETRLYPIDFPFPWREQYLATINIPEGYAVEELPESIRLKAEDGGMSATYIAEEKPDGTISINFSVSLDRTIYQPGDYPGLRNMFRNIIELQEASIVLKRAK